MARTVLVVVIIVTVLMFFLGIVQAYEWGESGYDYDPDSEDSNGDESSGGSDVPSDDIDTEIELDDWCFDNHNCTMVMVDLGIACYIDGRESPDTRIVLKDQQTYYGYGFDYEENDDTSGYKISKLVPENFFIQEAFYGSLTKTSDLESANAVLPYSANCYTNLDPPSCPLYEWSDDNYYTAYIPWITHQTGDDPRLYRYEGKGVEGYDIFGYQEGCRAYGGYFVKYDVAGVPVGIDQNQDKFYRDPLFTVDDPWAIPSWYGDFTSYGTDIIWDENPDDCSIIGGAWLDNDAYEDQQCCGDDYIWVMNRPLTEEESGLDSDSLEDDLEEIEEAEASVTIKYCLYSIMEDDDEGVAISVWLDESYYDCGQTMYDQYDDVVKDGYSWAIDQTEECYDEDGVLLSSCKYVLTLGYDDNSETDIGKWSALTGEEEQPQVCRIASTEKNVPTFSWTNVNDAGDVLGDDGYPLDIYGDSVTDLNNYHANTICEQYLGGVWTGSHCCGNKYDYEDDTTSWYDSDSDVGYIDESFSESVPIYYDETLSSIIHNYACVEGTVIDSVNAPTSSTVPRTAHQKTADGAAEVEVLNIDGTLYGCNLAADSSLSFEPDWYTKSTLLTDTNPCELKENTYLCNYNYSDWDGDGEADDEHWDWYHVKSDEEGSYVTNTLGYDGEAETSFTWSEPVWATEDQQPGACCAGRRCWDGASCVEEHTKYSYDDDSDEETEDVISICYNGDWTGTLETKYDWYHNTDAAAIDYCVNAYACVCSTEEDDNTFCTENEEYVVAGCTLTVDFYKDDHFCEAINPTDTDGDGVYAADSSRWTSRTKFLAFQMIQIAQDVGSEFTLFCDQYSDTLNNYVDVESIAEDINSFCILSQDSDVTISVTFNSDDEDQPMTIDAEQVEELLFEGSNAFVTDILGDEDVETCSSATSYTSSERFFGEFYSCDAATEHVFYNNVLNAIIYNENGLGTTLLNYPDTDAMQELLDGTSGVKTTITTYIDTTDDDELVNPAGDEIKENFAGFSTVEDYSSLYYSTENSATIIGFEDIKYDGESDNRYYMGVLYSGITLNCDQIYAPYDSALNIHCNSDTGIILERSTEGSEFWRSLTAGIRRE
jgi:hypothetical protein